MLFPERKSKPCMMSATGVNLDPSGVFQFIEHEENKGPECVNQVSQQLGLSAVMTLIVVRNSKMLARSWTSYWIYWNRWARSRNSMDQSGTATP